MRGAVARVLGSAFVAYAAAWIVGFIALVGDPAFVGDYLVRSLSGGGERVAYLQLFALIVGSLGGVFGALWHLYPHRAESK